jgi:hypothetical protein
MRVSQLVSNYLMLYRHLLYNGILLTVKYIFRPWRSFIRLSIKIQCLHFNAGIKSLRATLPDEIFTGDFALLFVNIYVKANKYTNYSFI